MYYAYLCKIENNLLLRLPVRRGGVINSPRSVFFLVSEVGLPLMGDTAVPAA